MEGIEEAVVHEMGRGGVGAMLRGESFAVAIPALAPTPVEVPSAFATLWAWAHLYRRRLYASDRENLWTAWRQWIATKPDKNRNWFMLLPIEARRVIMERQVDEYMALAEEGVMGEEVKHVRYDFDLNFTIVATVQEGYVEFAVYDIVGFTEDGSPCMSAIDSVSSFDCVDDIEKAEVYLSGSVKWDGCSNWRFDEQDRVMLHGCCRQHLQRFGDVMALCWDWAKELLPNWDGD